MQEMALEKAENLLLNVRDTEIILLIGAHHAENGLLGSSGRAAQPPASSRPHVRGNPSAE
jgi:hypothetical protein